MAILILPLFFFLGELVLPRLKENQIKLGSVLYEKKEIFKRLVEKIKFDL